MTTSAHVEQASQTEATCNPLLMVDWGKKESEACKPCIMGPVANWYYTELEERGRQDLAGELEDVVQGLGDGDTAEAIAPLLEILDSIKGRVDAPTLERLKDFDCAVQVFDGKVDDEAGPEPELTAPMAQQAPVAEN